MKTEKIQQLVDRFNSGEASSDEVQQIEGLIEQGEIALEDLNGLEKLERQILKLEMPVPSLELDNQFFEMLKKEKGAQSTFDWKTFFSWPEFAPRLAFACITLLIGVLAGYLLRSPENKEEQIAKLGLEINDLKEMMMLSLLEKESATDRLKAVALTEGMDQVSKKITLALLQTLNSDENINVRLAALDALRPYSKDSQVRESLIWSISQQKSPLVQVALAELMVDLQEKGAVKELKKILEDGDTPQDIKRKIRESIQVI